MLRIDSYELRLHLIPSKEIDLLQVRREAESFYDEHDATARAGEVHVIVVHFKIYFLKKEN